MKPKVFFLNPAAYVIWAVVLFFFANYTFIPEGAPYSRYKYLPMLLILCFIPTLLAKRVSVETDRLAYGLLIFRKSLLWTEIRSVRYVRGSRGSWGYVFSGDSGRIVIDWSIFRHRTALREALRHVSPDIEVDSDILAHAENPSPLWRDILFQIYEIALFVAVSLLAWYSGPSQRVVSRLFHPL